jgi:predicted amidohydrolase YtcJ
LPRERLKEVLLHCAANDIRAIANANVTPGVLDLFEEVDRAVPLKGRRWVVGHISTLAQRDIERLARLDLVVTTHTNRYIYKEGHRCSGGCHRNGSVRSHRCAISSMRV